MPDAILSSKRETGLAWVLLSCIVLYALLSYIRGTAGVCMMRDQHDFTAYYAAAKAMDRGRPIYNRSEWPLTKKNPLAEVRIRGEPNPQPTKFYLYPPFLAWALRPLTWLPYDQAEWIWFAFLQLCYWTGVIVWLRWMTELRWLSPREALVPAAAAAYWGPAFFAFWAGQIVVPVFALLAAHWVLAARGRFACAGALLGLAILLKPTPVWFLGLWLFRRRWRLVAAAALAIAAGVAVGGPSKTLHYVSSILPHVLLGENNPVNQTLWGTCLRMSLGRPWGWLGRAEYRSLPNVQWLVRGAMAACSLATLYLAGRAAPGRPFRLGFCAAVSGMLFFSPVARLYDFIYLYPAWVLLIADVKQTRSAAGIAVAAFAAAAHAANLSGYLSTAAWDGFSRDILNRPSCLAAGTVWLYAMGNLTAGAMAKSDRGLRPQTRPPIPAPVQN